MALPDDDKSNVIHLTGAEGRAILGAAEKACVAAELARNAALDASEKASRACAKADSADRGAWAAHGAINKLRDDIVVPGFKEVNKKLDNLAERTAKEVIRITAEQARTAELAKQAHAQARQGSSPELQELARVGLGLAQARADDEITEVKERRARSELAIKEEADRAEHRKKRRELLLTWVTRAAVVIGPLVTAALMKWCGQ